MKKLFALLLALLMLLGTCSALAEPSTAYYVSFLDPIVYANGEPILDMTGLNVDLGALVSDVGCFAVQALAYVGENYDIQAAGAQAQLDTNGLTFNINGMENIYSIDLSEYTYGFDITGLLPQIPAHTFLNTPIEMEAVSIDLSLPVRYAFVTGMLAEFTAEDGTITIDKNQGELIINRALTAMETAAESLNVDGVAELRAMRPSFDLTGTMTVDGDPAANAGSYVITGTGSFYAEDLEEGIPMGLSYSDSAEAMNMSVSLTEDGETMAFVVDTAFATAADGRSETNGAATLVLNEEELATITFSAIPVEESRQMDYVLSMDIPSEEVGAAILLSTNTNGDDLGFALDIFANDGEDNTGMYLYYAGEKFVEEDSTILDGYVSLGAEVNEESYGLDTYLLLEAATVDTAQWAYDSTGAISLENMSEAEMSSMQMGLMGVVGTALSAIMENVPGLAPIISSMMG